jgi:hypothetical protein
MGAQPSDSEIRAALQAYFQILQSNPTADEMRRTVVTDDFETGFTDGYKWQGLTGLNDFLSARAGFVDEQHEITTRLKFSLRQLSVDELFTGTAFHTWLLRRDDAGQLKIAAQIVSGFSDLNDNAKRLFATPTEGLNR